MTKEEDYIPGEWYYGDFNKGSGKDSYFILAKEKGSTYLRDTSYVRENDRTYSTSGSLEQPRFTVTRMATSREKVWLNACENAKKYIPQTEVKFDHVVNDYDIY